MGSTPINHPVGFAFVVEWLIRLLGKKEIVSSILTEGSMSVRSANLILRKVAASLAARYAVSFV